MSSRNKDELLRNFVAITGCPSKAAIEYLEAANWNTELATDFFFDSAGHQARAAPHPPTAAPPARRPPVQKKIPTHAAGAYDSDDDLLQSALEENLRLNASRIPEAAVPSRTDEARPTVASKIGTVGGLKKNERPSEARGQAFYAGGSESSGQEIIGPPQSSNSDAHVKNLFDAARRQGAREADRQPPSEAKKEKPFQSGGHALGDHHLPSRSQVPPSSEAPPGAAPRPPALPAEPLPVRVYSNGFTVGTGELRKFDENKEFMECLKRGEVPQELKDLNKDGRQVEVRLEDRRGEEYKPVAATFKPFGGSGHTVGLSAAAAAPNRQAPSKATMQSPPSTIPESTDTARLEQLAEKRLKTSSTSSTTIRLRLPDISTPLRIPIDLNRTLGDVRRFLTENIPALQSNAFEFLEPPATKISREDEKRRISDTKLSNSTLAVRRIA